MKVFSSLRPRSSATQKKYYKPLSTRAPSLFIFFVVIILCIVLLQNIAEQGTPIPNATTSRSNTTTPRKRGTSGDSDLVSLNATNATTVANSTVSVATSLPSSTSTCALATPPSDCGLVRSSGGSLPDYLVLCETYLESNAVVEFDTPYSYDYCASQCIADANCTGFGYYIGASGLGKRVSAAEVTDCSTQNYCWWTYETIPEMWGASLVTSTNPSAYIAGLVIPSNYSSSANATNTTDSSAASNSSLYTVSNSTNTTAANWSAWTASILASTNTSAMNSTITPGVLGVSNSSLFVVSNSTINSTVSSGSSATSNSSLLILSNSTMNSTVSATASGANNTLIPIVLIVASASNSTTSPPVASVSTLSAILVATTTTSSSSVCATLVAPTDCNAITILEDSVQIEVLCDTAIENVAEQTTATSWEDCALQCLDDLACTAFTLDTYLPITRRDLTTPCCLGDPSCDSGIYSCYWTTDALPLFDTLGIARRSTTNSTSGKLISANSSAGSTNSTSSTSSSTSSTLSSSSPSSSVTTTTSSSSLLTTTSSSSSSVPFPNSTISTTTTSNTGSVLLGITTTSSSLSLSSSTYSSTTSSSSLFTSLSSSSLSSTSSSTLSRTTSFSSSSASSSSSSSSSSSASSSTLSRTTSSSSSSASSSTLSRTPSSTSSLASSSSSASSSSLSSSASLSTLSRTTSSSSPSVSSSTLSRTTSSSTLSKFTSSSAPTTSSLSTTRASSPTPASISSGSTISVPTSSSSSTSTSSLSSSTSRSSSSLVPLVVSTPSINPATSTSSVSSTSSGSPTSSANPAPSASISSSTSDATSPSTPAPTSTSANASNSNSNSVSANANNSNSIPATNANTANTTSAATAAAALASGSNPDSGNNRNSQNGNGNGDGSGSGGSGSSDSQDPPKVADLNNGTQPVPSSTYSGFLSQYVYIIPGKITVFAIINATFAAVTMSVLFKSFWCWVLAASRMMEPFYHLFRPSGASAEESLLLPYIGAGTAWKSLDPRNKRWVMLLTTCVAFMLSAMAELGSEAMTVRAGSTCNTNGGRTLCDPQWVLNMAVLRAIQATLGLAAVSIVVLGYWNWPKRSGLAVYPASIASMADMLRHSDEELIQDLCAIDSQATDEDIRKALAGKRYTLTRIDSPTAPKHGIKCTPGPPSRRTTTLESANKPPATSPKQKPWYKRIPYSHILHTLLHITLFLIILLFLLDGNDTYIISLTKSNSPGAALVSLPFRFLDGTRFGPRFILSLLCVLLSRYWEEIEVDVRILSPYRALRNQKLSRMQLDRMRLHGVPLTMVWHALRAGNWFHAFVAGVTVASYALVILVAGVPYTYGEVKRLSLISSAASVGVLGSMILGLVGVWVWKRTGPEMVRKPDTLVNVWLLLCGSRMLEGRGDVDGDENEDENRRFWYGKGVGTDGVERWMVDDGVDGGKG